nr:hypothetical protein GCM10017611_43790 [Rhodococcus wratislaviensis]
MNAMTLAKATAHTDFGWWRRLGGASLDVLFVTVAVVVLTATSFDVRRGVDGLSG